MTEVDNLRAIVAKAITDEKFCKKLMEDPEAAVKEAGIDLSSEQLKALKEMDKEKFNLALSEMYERMTMAGLSPLDPARL